MMSPLFPAVLNGRAIKLLRASRGKVKAGDLVKIVRPSLGIPRDTVGLVLNSEFADSGFRYFKIHMFGVEVHMVGKARRFLGRDLEVISESR